jgi:hypothetical protein
MAVTAFMFPMFFTTSWSKELNAAATDVWKVALSNTAYTYVATHKYFDAAPFSTAWTELGTANGYTAGGATLTAPTITSAQTTSWSATVPSPTWTASGAGISATSAVYYDSTPGAGVKPIMAYVLFGGTVTAPSGATLTITPSGSGIISVVVA